MRILIATGIYPPDIGGPATYSHLLKLGFPRYGVEVDVLSFGEVRHLPKIFRHFIYFLKLVWLGRNVNVIFAQDPVSVGLPAACVAFLLRKSLLLKVVGDYAWEQGVQRFGVKELSLDSFLNKKYGFKVQFLRRIERFVARRAKKIIVPSQYLKKVVVDWGISEDKIFVVYNAYLLPVSLSAWSHRTGMSEKTNLNLKGKVLLSAGRLVPWKGFAVLIEVMSDLLKLFPDLQLVIIGDGPDRKILEDKRNKLGLEESVYFTGSLSHTDVMEYLVASDIFVLNTSYEGFSHQLLEAMVVGKPIVTTRAGGNPELIDEKSAFMVDFNDREGFKTKITQIFASGFNPILFDSAGANQKYFMVGEEVKTRIRNAHENAKKISKDFSVDRMIKETLEVLRDVS